MATSEDKGRNPSRNPGNPITDVEATNVDVRGDAGLNAVEMTVTDARGDGFRTYFGLDQALDVVLRVVAAVARLRGWSVP
jgi:hypothetical protein